MMELTIFLCTSFAMQSYAADAPRRKQMKMQRTKSHTLLLLSMFVGYSAGNFAKPVAAQQTFSPARTDRFLSDDNRPKDR